MTSTKKNKAETMRVRYSPGEAAAWRRAARAELLTLSAWVRQTLTRMARKINAKAAPKKPAPRATR